MTDRNLQSIPAESALSIVGAGPIGLEAAAWAACNGLDFAVFERGEVAQHVSDWGHVKLFTPFEMLRSEWGLGLLASQGVGNLPAAEDFPTGRLFRDSYLLPLSRAAGIRERLFRPVNVVSIGRQGLSKKDWIGEARRSRRPFRLLIESNGRERVHLTRAVIDASGIYANPQWLGDGNIPAPGERRAAGEAADRFHYRMVDVAGRPERFAGRRFLLAGAGHSAATHLEAFCNLAEGPARVEWVCRGRRDEPFTIYPDDPLPYRDQLGRLGNRLAQDPPSWLSFRKASRVEAILSWPQGSRGDFEISINGPQGPETIRVDEILASVGFRPDASLYRQLQIHECYATEGPIKLAATLLGGSSDCLAQQPQGVEVLASPEPNFFILGNKSYGTNSAFLLAHGIDQVRQVMGQLKQSLEDEQPRAAVASRGGCS